MAKELLQLGLNPRDGSSSASQATCGTRLGERDSRYRIPMIESTREWTQRPGRAHRVVDVWFAEEGLVCHTLGGVDAFRCVAGIPACKMPRVRVSAIGLRPFLRKQDEREFSAHLDM